MFAQLLLAPALALWSTRQRYEFRYIALTLSSVLLSIVTPLIGLLAVYYSDDKTSAKIYSSVLIQSLFGLFFILVNYRKSKTFFNKKYWKYALTFSIPLIPHYLGNIILIQSDRVLIEKFCSTKEVGIYSVAYSASMVLLLIVTTINQSYVPWSFKKLKEKKFNEISKITTFLILAVAYSIVLIILLGPEIITLLAPKEYYQAIWVIPPVAISCFFIFIYTLFGNIEFYFEKKGYVAIASISSAILNLLLNLVLIPLFGYLAAAYTTLACYIILSILHYCFMKKILRNNLNRKSIYDERIIFIVSLFMIIITIGAVLLYPITLFRYLLISILIIIPLLRKKKLLEIARKYN